jgi:hypothetical protein
VNIDSILKSIRGIVRLRGGTDNTLIGNEADKLKTFSAIDPNNNAVTVDNTDSNPVPVEPTEAAQAANLVVDAKAFALLGCILEELKKQNFQLSLLTDFDSKDVYKV